MVRHVGGHSFANFDFAVGHLENRLEYRGTLFNYRKKLKCMGCLV